MFSFQDLVKIAKEMKGLIDQTGGAMACPFYPTFLRPNLLSACSKKGRDAILYTLPHASNLLLEGLPSVAFVDANIPRDGAGALLLTQMHPKCFPSPFPHKNAVTEQSCLSTNSHIHGITPSTRRKVSVHCYLNFAGMKNNSSNKTYLLALHLLPNNMGCRTAGKEFWR